MFPRLPTSLTSWVANARVSCVWFAMPFCSWKTLGIFCSYFKSVAKILCCGLCKRQYKAQKQVKRDEKEIKEKKKNREKREKDQRDVDGRLREVVPVERGYLWHVSRSWTEGRTRHHGGKVSQPLVIIICNNLFVFTRREIFRIFSPR